MIRTVIARGVYRNNLEKNSSSNFREMIVLEFSNNKKSEMFYGSSDIIGPRNIYLSKEINLNEILLRKNIFVIMEIFTNMIYVLLKVFKLFLRFNVLIGIYIKK